MLQLPAENTRPHPVASVPPAPSVAVEQGKRLDTGSVKWSWSCRRLVNRTAPQDYYLTVDRPEPRPADVALVQVEKVGHHRLVETENERRLRLYPGDRLIAVFGNRYATDVYEGLVLGVDKLHMLTGSGMIGTVVSRHRDASRPTGLSFVSYLTDASGRRINLKELGSPALSEPASLPQVILVVGTGMNAGKTTVTRKILRGLVSRGVRVAGCKLTGSVSSRDLQELRSIRAVHATDFSDYGFPSTYGATLSELMRLFEAMLNASIVRGAQVVVIEIADGFLQRETQMLLSCDDIRQRVRGTVVAGTCSGSSLHAVGALQKFGFEVWAVSGLITNSPLFSHEFASHSSIPIASSRGSSDPLAQVVMTRLDPLSLDSLSQDALSRDPQYGRQ